MQFSILYKILLTTILIGMSGMGFAQYTLGISGSYTVGANSSPIKLSHQPVDQNWHQGYQFNLWNGYQLKESPIEITTRLGMKHLRSEGSMNAQDFRTETYKFQLGAGALYHFESDFSAGALFIMENNLDVDEFISQTADLFRYSLQLEASYLIWSGLAIRAHYSFALGPFSHHYLVTNPQHQLGIGLQYKIL